MLNKRFPSELPRLDKASESSIEGRLMKAVKAVGGIIIKLPAQWYTGIPDRLVLLPGAKIFFVELKRKAKKARRFQRWWIRKLRGLGFTAGVVAGNEALEKFLQTYVNL